MVMKNGFRKSVLLLLFFGLIAPMLSAVDDGRKLYTTKFCITCHGQKGVAVAPNYPNLAGQSEKYIFNQVKDILSEERKSKLTILMTENPVVKKMTDEELAAIASFMTKVK